MNDMPDRHANDADLYEQSIGHEFPHKRRARFRFVMEGNDYARPNIVYNDANAYTSHVIADDDCSIEYIDEPLKPQRNECISKHLAAIQAELDKLREIIGDEIE